MRYTRLGGTGWLLCQIPMRSGGIRCLNRLRTAKGPSFRASLSRCGRSLQGARGGGPRIDSETNGFLEDPGAPQAESTVRTAG